MIDAPPRRAATTMKFHLKTYGCQMNVNDTDIVRSILLDHHRPAAATFAAGPRLFRLGDTPFAGGLPGLIADSLPDAWGERSIANARTGSVRLAGNYTT